MKYRNGRRKRERERERERERGKETKKRERDKEKGKRRTRAQNQARREKHCSVRKMLGLRRTNFVLIHSLLYFPGNLCP